MPDIEKVRGMEHQPQGDPPRREPEQQLDREPYHPEYYRRAVKDDRRSSERLTEREREDRWPIG